jgi:hypothetical protein
MEKNDVKQCRCNGSSSGPRMYPQIFGKDALVLGFAEMVCDLCETPWKKESIDNVVFPDSTSIKSKRNAKRRIRK